MSRFKRVEEVFQHAADMEPRERSLYLDQACAGDQSLRSEVESLLGSMNTDITGPIAAAAALVELPDEVPETLGSYRIIRVLGEGGMGRVYEAEQDSPRRSVALKVIRPGLMSRSVLRRFTHEANVLGQLKHPAIAQVYQAGTLPAPDGTLGGGQPYFAMELVNGPNLSEWVRERSPRVRETLEMIALVCDGVQHAHQRGVIHRDLKPGNILIEESAGRGPGTVPAQPKILDFGIARLVDDATRPAMTQQTEAGQIVGTLSYMSPEQIDGEVGAVDTRTDVYALGVIAYELLSGRLPIDVAGKTIVEAARLIRDTEPRRLGLTDRAYAGDVETIVAKAMEKERERRYSSAGELASDIRRYLNHEPILARPTSAVYQLTKFARRNKPLVGGALIAAAAVVVGGAAAVWQAVAATKQRNVAVAAERRATALKDFLVKDVFGSASTRDKGPAIPAGELLAQAGSKIDQRFKDDPELRIEAERLMFALQSEMGQPVKAVEHARRVFAKSSDFYGSQDRRTVRSELDLAEMLLDAEQTDEVEPKVGELVERIRRLYGDKSGEDLRVSTLLGLLHIQRSRLEEAKKTLEDTYSRHVGHFQRSETGYFRLLAALASIAAIRDDNEGHLRWARELLTFATTDLPSNRFAVSSAYQALAQALMKNGQLEEAERIMREGLERDRDFLMPNDPDRVRALGLYGIILANMKRFDEAEKVFQEVSSRTTERLGAAAWESYTMRRRLLTLYVRADNMDKAERWLRDEAALQTTLHSAEQPPAMEPMRHLAQLYMTRGRVQEAKAIMDDLEPRVRKAFPGEVGPEHRHFMAAMDITRGMLERRIAGGDPEKVKHARELIERGRAVHAQEWSSSYPEIARIAQSELDEIDGVKTP